MQNVCQLFFVNRNNVFFLNFVDKGGGVRHWQMMITNLADSSGDGSLKSDTLTFTFNGKGIRYIVLKKKANVCILQVLH